jgi:hypothetical protein
MTRNLHGAFLVSREIYPNPVTECYGTRNAEAKIKSLVMVNYPKTVAKYLNRLIRIGRTKSIHITLSKNFNPNVTVTLKPLPQRYFVRLFQRDGKLIRKYLCDPFKNKKQMGSPKQLFYHAVLNYPEKK